MDFDLITLGAGSGGVAGSRRAAMHGARVAVVERGRVGGTCVLRGCVPKKLMMYAGQYGPALADAARFGWSTADASFDMARWQAAKRAELERLERIYIGMLDGAGVTLLRGEACIEAPGRVRVGEQVYGYRKLLVATGGRPNTL
ncbi:MAG: FAD-dependent oxidoreductase, partial [Burkholderiales bacterium]